MIIEHGLFFVNLTSYNNYGVPKEGSCVKSDACCSCVHVHSSQPAWTGDRRININFLHSKFYVGIINGFIQVVWEHC